MYTSNFAKCRNVLDFKLISIAKGTPPWFEDRVYVDLQPPQSLINRFKSGEISWSQYSDQYKRRVLSKLTPKQVVKELGDDAILLCWCKADEHCHRHLVAEWLRSAGYSVEEV